MKPGKAIKRSARAVERLSKNTGKRADEAQAALQGNTYDADMFARHAAGQVFDSLRLWLDFLGAGASGPPEAYIEIVVSGTGTGSVTGSATVELEDPISSLALLQMSDLVAPGETIKAGNITLTAVPAGSTPVEVIKIDVSVPNNKVQTLYRGYISDAAAVQVEVSVSVHT